MDRYEGESRKPLAIVACFALVCCTTCGTFYGSYSTPPEALQAAETGRFIDQALAGVDFGPPMGGFGALDLSCSCTSDTRLPLETAGGHEQELQRGIATKSTPFRLPITQVKGGVKLHVTTPTIAAFQGVLALVGMEEAGTETSDAVEIVASRAIATAEALRFLSRTGDITDATRRRLVEQLCSDMGTLTASQQVEGGWGRGQSIPTTARALEALIELRALGLPVPLSALRLAAGYLLSRREMRAVPVTAPDRFRVAMTFTILASLPDEARSELFNREMSRLAELLTEELSSFDEPGAHRLDAPTQAVIVNGISRYQDWAPPVVHRATLWLAARRAWQRRHEVEVEVDETSWVPEWLETQGGEVVATSFALEALRRFDPEWFEALRREVLRMLLATQGAPGSWGEPHQTALAIRMLLLLNPVPERAPREGVGTTTVSLDGDIILQVMLDDPFAAAEALSDIDVEVGAGSAAGVLEVSIDAELSAVIHVESFTGL